MAASKSAKLLKRLNGILALFIGIFGALAILGVFFKIAKYPNYELFMAVGFFGEAAAFVVMGVLAFIASFMKTEDEAPAGGSALAFSADAGDEFNAALREATAEFRESLQAVSTNYSSSMDSYRSSMEAASAEFRDSMQSMLRENLSTDLEGVAVSVKDDVQHFGTEMRGLGGEMARARSAVQAMSAEMESVATGTLADDVEMLGTGMRQLSEGMSEAGSSVDRMRADLKEMATRFHAFNGTYKASENGIGMPVSGRNEKAGVA